MRGLLRHGTRFAAPGYDSFKEYDGYFRRRPLRARGDGHATLRAALPRLLAARFTGTAEEIADELALWRDAGIDGFNVMDVPAHSAFWEFAERLAPVLQQRGLMQTDYTPGALRHKIFSGGARVPVAHPASAGRVADTSD